MVSSKLCVLACCFFCDNEISGLKGWMRCIFNVFWCIVDVKGRWFSVVFFFFFRQQALFHVLAAYSVYNTEVGYCQGMSEIAALLLMYLNEEVKNSDIGCGISEIKIQRLREGEKKTFKRMNNVWNVRGTKKREMKGRKCWCGGYLSISVVQVCNSIYDTLTMNKLFRITHRYAYDYDFLQLF